MSRTGNPARSFICPVVIFALFFLVSLPGPAVRAGVLDLDKSFAGGGLFTAYFGANPDSTEGSKIFVQPGNRIVAAGGTGGFGAIKSPILMGLTPQGTLDPAFGNGGKVAICNCFFDTAATYADSEMLADGRILLLYTIAGFKIPTSPQLVQLTSNGTADPGFSANSFFTLHGYSGEKVNIRSDGKINVLISIGSNKYLVRLGSNGSRDTSFGDKGIKPLSLERTGSASISDMKTQEDGKILLSFPGKILRLNSDGFLDHTFGNQGLVDLSLFTNLSIGDLKLLIQSDGKIVLLGSAENRTILMRLSRRGKFDGTFGNAGIVVTNFSQSGVDFASAGALNSSGEILIAGQAIVPPSASAFLIAKFRADGSLAGSTITPFPAGPASANGIALQPDGKILAVGYTITGSSSKMLAIARYLDSSN